MKKERADMRKAVKGSEQDTLQMLVDLFDWLDSREKGVDPDQLQRINESSDYMKRKAELPSSGRGNCQGPEAR